MSTDTDLGEALRDAMGKTNVNWGHVRRLCEEIDRQKKQAALVAKRLMGSRSRFKKCPNCRGRGMVETYCKTCFGTGEVLND